MDKEQAHWVWLFVVIAVGSICVLGASAVAVTSKQKVEQEAYIASLPTYKQVRWNLKVEHGRLIARGDRYEGCAWVTGEKVPVLNYEVTSTTLTVDVLHSTCHRLILANSGTSFPGIMQDNTIDRAVIGIDSMGVPSDGKVDPTGFNGYPARLLIVAPPCTKFTEIKVQQYIIKDIRSDSSSSVLLGLVYNSRSSNTEKQYQYDIQHTSTPLTICAK